MARIVTSTYRYKRPPRKRKVVALEVPAVVRKNGRRPRWKEAAAEVEEVPRFAGEAARIVAQPAPADVFQCSVSMPKAPTTSAVGGCLPLPRFPFQPLNR
jgi:hypothetical protein